MNDDEIRKLVCKGLADETLPRQIPGIARDVVPGQPTQILATIGSFPDPCAVCDDGRPDVQAPRSQDVQAPRSQDVQAPRSQDVQAPRASMTAARSAELKKATTLVKEAEAACKAGKTDMAADKAKAAMEMLKK